jgi:hypothetical protein
MEAAVEASLPLVCKFSMGYTGMLLFTAGARLSYLSTHGRG